MKLKRRGFMRDRPLAEGDPRTLGEFMKLHRVDELPVELTAFRGIHYIDDLRSFFPFADNLRQLGFERGDTFLNVRYEDLPEPEISAALLGGRGVGIDLTPHMGGDADLAILTRRGSRRLVSTLLETEVGGAIREVNGSVESKTGNFADMDFRDNSAKAVLLMNVLNYPPNREPIAEKALNVTEPGGVVILTDSNNMMKTSIQVLEDAAKKLGVRLEEVKDISPEVPRLGLRGRDVAFRVHKK